MNEKATVFDRVQYQRERAERAEAEAERLRIATHDMHIPCVHRAETAEARVAELEAEFSAYKASAIDAALRVLDERDAALDLLRGVVIPRVAGDPSVTERIEAARAFLALVDRVDSGKPK